MENAYCKVSRHIAMNPGRHRALAETAKARVRVFGHDKVRYRGLERNVQRLALLLGFSNLMIAQPHLQ